MEKISETHQWEDTFDALVVAHKNATCDSHNEKKHQEFKDVWNRALDEATTSEEMERLNRYVPTDHVDDWRSLEAQKRIREKWDQAEENEESGAGDDLVKLKHAYDHAPLNERRQIALEKLVSAITEKDARHFHNESNPGSDLSLALENKFPSLFAKNKDTRIEDFSPKEGGLDDMEESENINITENEDDGSDDNNAEINNLEEVKDGDNGSGQIIFSTDGSEESSEEEKLKKIGFMGRVIKKITESFRQ